MKRTFIRFALIVAVAIASFFTIAFSNDNSNLQECTEFQKENCQKTPVHGEFIIWESLAASILEATQ